VSATDPHQVFHRTIEAVWRIESARVIAGLTLLTAPAKRRAVDLFCRNGVAERKCEELACELQALERVLPSFPNHLVFGRAANRRLQPKE
jgi:hypothetical protein